MKPTTIFSIERKKNTDTELKLSSSRDQTLSLTTKMSQKLDSLTNITSFTERKLRLVTTPSSRPSTGLSTRLSTEPSRRPGTTLFMRLNTDQLPTTRLVRFQLSLMRLLTEMMKRSPTSKSTTPELEMFPLKLLSTVTNPMIPVMVSTLMLTEMVVT